jgi:hypothetical protein
MSESVQVANDAVVYDVHIEIAFGQRARVPGEGGQLGGVGQQALQSS